MKDKTIKDYENATTSGVCANATTSGEYARATTAGAYADASALGVNSVASALGVHSKAMCGVGGSIVIADWREAKGVLVLRKVYSAKCGGKIRGTTIKPNTWYWFENGELQQGGFD